MSKEVVSRIGFVLGVFILAIIVALIIFLGLLILKCSFILFLRAWRAIV